MKKTLGKVYIVGAGPGDPELITVRGRELIRDADVIVLDALVNPAVLRERTSPGLIYAGKRGPGAPKGSSARLSQSEINRLLIRQARQGKRVVRLKGGDPSVFGRLSEELEALRKARIPYEIVPGVSSAIAVPAYAGIPVTDRRLASHVTFVTGREAGEAGGDGQGIDWESLPKGGTLVILMGVSEWPRLQAKLLKAGWSQDDPLAFIESGTLPGQRIFTTTLGRSKETARKNKLVAPSIVVIGDVVRLQRKLNWWLREKPLLGKKVVVTRPLHQSEPLMRELRQKGAETIVCPVIRIDPIETGGLVRDIVEKMSDPTERYDWIVFLSANAVEMFARSLGPSKSLLRGRAICVVGPQTAEAARAQGWIPRKMAVRFNAKAALRALGPVRGRRLLIPRAKDAPPDFVRDLLKRGAFVEEVIVYQTVPNPLTKSQRKSILSGVDAVTFTSGSTVKSFCESFSARERSQIFKRALAGSIGPSTSRTLRHHGILRILESFEATAEGLVESLCRHFKPK